MQDFWVVHLRGLGALTQCNIRVAKLRGSFDSVNEQKNSLVLWCTSGDSNPGPTD